MNRRMPPTAAIFAIMAVIGIGGLLVVVANERDRRADAEDRAAQSDERATRLAKAANDMIEWQFQQVKAKTFRLERIAEETDK